MVRKDGMTILIPGKRMEIVGLKITFHYLVNIKVMVHEPILPQRVAGL